MMNDSGEDFCRKDVLIHGKRLRNTGELIINEQLRNMEDCDCKPADESST